MSEAGGGRASGEKAAWLPNLVGGVSIWKLAPDLNEPQFFDGRLLVPETEGSDSLPLRVTWSLAGLVPLADARATHPHEAALAVTEFLACLERVAAELAKPTSGYHKYKEAFTVPGLEGAGARSYFYDPHAHKLRVINWGASPRSMGGEEALVFGYSDFGKMIGKQRDAEGAAPPPGGHPSAGAAAAIVAASPAALQAPASEEKKKEEEKKPAAGVWMLWGRPFWVWLLVLVGILLLLLLLLLLLRSCNDKAFAGADAGDAASDVLQGGDGETASAPDGSEHAGGAGTAGDGDGDANAGVADAGPDAKDARADAKGTDAGGDGKGDDGGGDAATAGGAGAGGGGASAGASAGDSGVASGGASAGASAGGASSSDGRPHRAHFHPEAVRWKITAGQDLLDTGSPPSSDGDTFEVFLKKGASFEKVRVSWQDKAGKWHTH